MTSQQNETQPCDDLVVEEPTASARFVQFVEKEGLNNQWDLITSESFDAIPLDKLYHPIMNYKPIYRGIGRIDSLLTTLRICRYKMEKGDYTDEERVAAVKLAVSVIRKLRCMNRTFDEDLLIRIPGEFNEIDESLGIDVVGKKTKKVEPVPDWISKRKNATKPAKNN